MIADARSTRTFASAPTTTSSRSPDIIQPDDVGDLTAEQANKGAFALIEMPPKRSLGLNSFPTGPFPPTMPRVCRL